ncbi:hypothetical protein N0V90_004500 [Kalmusia sp. IMI 367209]|nr:hypothetical protein N0V90_004500 [Kalmusia sp. IMI 367209]
MAKVFARKTSWLALLAGSATVTAQSAFWTYTSRFQDCYYPYTYYDGDTTSMSTWCDIKSTVTPTVSPTSTSTYSYSTGDLELVYAWYTSNAVAESDIIPYSRYDPDATTTTETTTSTYHVFSMQVTYTAPTYCETPFTVTTNASVSVPTEVLDQVTPFMVITSTPTPTRRATYVFETWYFSEGDVPFTSSDDYYYTAYVEECSLPYYAYPTYTGSSSGGYGGGTSGSGSGSGSGSSDDWEVCYLYSGCTSLKTWIIIIAALIPSLFVLGFFESYFWFRRLMLGKGCLRFGTIFWICISLWVACFTRTQSRRSPEDQKLLREKWKNTSFGTAIKLWFRWGFRHRYPVPLLGQYSRNTVGIVPEGQPLPVPGMPPPGAFYPSGAPAPGQGQVYYPPPQGWVPAPNGQGYPMPPPGQAYMAGANGAPQYYGEQSKEAPSVTTTTVSPVNGAPQPVPSPVSPTLSSQPPPPHVAEAPSPTPQPTQTATMPQPPAQLPTDHNTAPHRPT